MPANNPNSAILNPNSPALRLTTGILQSSSPRRTNHCRFVRACRVRASGDQVSNIEITPQALQTAYNAGLFNGKAVFIDHAALWDPHVYGTPSLENLVGVTQSSTWNEAEGTIEGTIKLYSNGPGTSIVVITVDYDGATGTAAADLTVVLTFTEG